MQEQFFVETVRQHGGRVYAVGGWVRDSLLAREAKDKDYVISGFTAEQFQKLFPGAASVGKAFPVYILEIGNVNCEVALARKEKKNGRGYCGFSVEYNSSITIEEDLYRRDTTMNSIAVELPEGTLVDPFGGAKDIAYKIIRATSQHFLEDPVRALRAARQAAELGFSIAEETLGFMQACKEEILDEPQERILREMERALQSDEPSVFFRILQKAGLLEPVFPEVFALVGKTQPKEFHPEGDAFEHSMQILDRVAAGTERVPARFAALVHDIGKGTTPKEMEPHHYGHEKRGIEVLLNWNQRCRFPKIWLKSALLVIREHMRAPLLEKPGKIVALLLEIAQGPLEFSEFNQIILADHGALPIYLQEYTRFLERIRTVSGKKCPPDLQGNEIGTWILQQQIKAYMMELE